MSVLGRLIGGVVLLAVAFAVGSLIGGAIPSGPVFALRARIGPTFTTGVLVAGFFALFTVLLYIPVAVRRFPTASMAVGGGLVVVAVVGYLVMAEFVIHDVMGVTGRRAALLAIGALVLLGLFCTAVSDTVAAAKRKRP